MDDIQEWKKLNGILGDIISGINQIQKEIQLCASPWMDIFEASKYLKLSVSTLHKLTSKGKIPFKRVGDGSRSKLLFSRKQLDLWIMTGKTKSYSKRDKENLESWI